MWRPLVRSEQGCRPVSSSNDPKTSIENLEMGLARIKTQVPRHRSAGKGVWSDLQTDRAPA
jgi:hypothetical protein